MEFIRSFLKEWKFSLFTLIKKIYYKRNVWISCGDEEQIVGVSQFENSIGITVGNVVYLAIRVRGNLKIQGLCFDITAVNNVYPRGTAFCYNNK